MNTACFHDDIDMLKLLVDVGHAKLTSQSVDHGFETVYIHFD
jgi:hypothetical protein